MEIDLGNEGGRLGQTLNLHPSYHGSGKETAWKMHVAPPFPLRAPPTSPQLINTDSASPSLVDPSFPCSDAPTPIYRNSTPYDQPKSTFASRTLIFRDLGKSSIPRTIRGRKRKKQKGLIC
ncbi:hypothetical protein M501DRAFT_877528 [Patellaria atrata CBS 101060]|uniref:Uncharacterized protein n=1 Tax=Patellaria atrata CBS 101060 TaxID=1346257 RepID=A0A9P4S9D1_9PEZI|nr:hypothetical protein M501DRAFT_877528 [Patellaria atrata CBS 101060]